MNWVLQVNFMWSLLHITSSIKSCHLNINNSNSYYCSSSVNLLNYACSTCLHLVVTGYSMLGLHRPQAGSDSLYRGYHLKPRFVTPSMTTAIFAKSKFQETITLQVNAPTNTKWYLNYPQQTAMVNCRQCQRLDVDTYYITRTHVLLLIMTESEQPNFFIGGLTRANKPKTGICQVVPLMTNRDCLLCM